MTTGPEVLARLRAAGVTVLAYDGKLRLSAPRGVIGEELRSLAAAHKPAVLAALTGRPVPSHVPGVVWHPAGGVALADPEQAARRACWRAGRRLGFPVVGREGWASFATTAAVEHVVETLLFLYGWEDATPAGATSRAQDAGGAADGEVP